jgi:hypothetical protein
MPKKKTKVEIVEEKIAIHRGKKPTSSDKPFQDRMSISTAERDIFLSDDPEDFSYFNELMKIPPAVMEKQDVPKIKFKKSHDEVDTKTGKKVSVFDEILVKKVVNGKEEVVMVSKTLPVRPYKTYEGEHIIKRRAGRLVFKTMKKAREWKKEQAKVKKDLDVLRNKGELTAREYLGKIKSEQNRLALTHSTTETPPFICGPEYTRKGTMKNTGYYFTSSGNLSAARVQKPRITVTGPVDFVRDVMKSILDNVTVKNFNMKATNAGLSKFLTDKQDRDNGAFCSDTVRGYINPKLKTKKDDE